MPADKPAATEHGTGSGEAKVIREQDGSCNRCGFVNCHCVPSPTVTLDRETADHVRDYILPVYESRAKIMAAVSYHDFAKDKCGCGGCWLYRQLERLGDALTLLRAAERQK